MSPPQSPWSLALFRWGLQITGVMRVSRLVPDTRVAAQNRHSGVPVIAGCCHARIRLRPARFVRVAALGPSRAAVQAGPLEAGVRRLPMPGAGLLWDCAGTGVKVAHLPGAETYLDPGPCCVIV
jgi:hypothetical protein